MNQEQIKNYLTLKNVLIGISAFFIVLILGRSLFSSYERPKKEAVDETVTVMVKNFSSEPQVKILTLRGQTEANRSLVLKSEIAGTINFIEEKGVPLKAGATIAKIADDSRDEQLAQAEALVKQRKLEYDAAQKLTKQSFKSEVSLAQQLSLLKAAETALAAIEVELERTNVKAPFDCILNDHRVELGDYVKVADPIANIAELSPIKVTADVSEAEVGLIKEGTPAQAVLSNGTKVNGKIVYISSVAHPQTRTFKVEVEIPNEDFAIKDGLTTDLFVPVNNVSAHKVPTSILSLNDEGVLGVKGVDKNNKVLFYPISIISQEKDGIWVDGLPDQIKLITVGQDFYSTGQTVKVKMQ